MQESSRKGLESYPDPRSCSGHREVTAEAWRGASAGWAIELRTAAIGVPTLLDCSGRPHGRGRYRKSFADPASSKTPGTSRHFLHENRKTSEMSARPPRPDGEVQARRHTASVHVSEESDYVIVPRNPSNKDGHPSADRGERSACTKEHARPSHTPPTQRGARVSQGLARARERRQEPYTALLYHLTVDRLRDSFYELKRPVAPGVDGVTWQADETGLDDRLADLHRRVHCGSYRAQPSRRVYIPKPDGR
jgi:RNA-directed DNA polymerase